MLHTGGKVCFLGVGNLMEAVDQKMGNYNSSGSMEGCSAGQELGDHSSGRLFGTVASKL